MEKKSFSQVRHFKKFWRLFPILFFVSNVKKVIRRRMGGINDDGEKTIYVIYTHTHIY